MIIERILSKTKKSKCCGSEIEMNTSIQSSYTPPKLVTPKDIELNVITETDSK